MYRIILIPCKICPLPFIAVSVFHLIGFIVAMVFGTIVGMNTDLSNGLAMFGVIGIMVWAHMMFVKEKLIAAAWEELDRKYGESGE